LQMLGGTRIFPLQEKVSLAMAEHEPSVGQSDDWFTPRSIFDALGLTFDLDPCSPGAEHWVPARRIYTFARLGFAVIPAARAQSDPDRFPTAEFAQPQS
jgi:hypothetical protein